MSDHLTQRTLEWIEGDPDPETRGELTALLEAEEWDDLAERMNGVLEFGTAGLRGVVQAGSNRMNRAVVIRTTAGLARFVAERRSGPVVVGFDGRRSSPRFAEDTVGVLVAAGHEVRYFADPVPTPIVAFTAKDIGAAAAVVVTASHNPPADNGYKVYDSNAAQIIPPVDTQIAASIDAIGPAAEVPRVENAIGGASELARVIDVDKVYDRYRSEVESVRRTTEKAADITVAYTPIHGVGWRFMQRLLADGGYEQVSVVASQAEPDGRFPTVPFPNPEEPGAMDAVMELGTDVAADLVIANDPDVDRLAVAIPRKQGQWERLTGNQIGVLLADWLLGGWSGPGQPIVINSIVSSPMLAAVANLWGARFEQTLTGFKWICNAAMDLERNGEGTFVFGYEEALGYSVGRVVRDKDGMSAGLVFADMVSPQEAEGATVTDRLADLYRRAGLWVSTQASVTRPGAEGIAEIDAAMERVGVSGPDAVGGRAVVASDDYRLGAGERPRWLPETPLVAFHLEDGGRVLVRPSGTEPKLKIYVDLPGEAGDHPISAETSLSAKADEVAAEMVEWLNL